MGLVHVGKRTGWGRLPLTKRTPGQQAFRKPGVGLSQAETSLTDVLQLVFEAMPLDIEQMFTATGLQTMTRDMKATAEQFRPLIEDVLRQQFIRSQREAEDELAQLLSRAYSRVGKADTPTPSEVALMGFRFDRRNFEASGYARTRAGELITNMTDSQRDIMRELITDAYSFQNTPQTTARALFDALRETSPSNPAAQEFARLFGTNMNGLTARYEQAVINRGTSLAAELTGRGVSAEKIVERVERETVKYADKLRRARSRTIARTEILRANNEGRLATFRSAQERGLLSNAARKRWQTSSLDVCPICVPLNGQLAPINEPFDNGLMTPPAHPNCRCSFNIVPNIETYDVPTVSGTGVEGDPFRLTPGGRDFTPEFDDLANTPLTPPAPPAPLAPTATPAPAPISRPPLNPGVNRTVLDDLDLDAPGGRRGKVIERINAANQVAKDLDEIIMVPTSGIVKTDVSIGERATKQLGGRFYHPRQSTKRAEIRVNQRQNGTLGEFQQSFAHEFGHRIDYEPFYKYNMTTSNVVEASKRVADPRTNSLDRGVAQKLLDRVGPETVQAILDLMDAAGKSESLARVLKGASKSYAEYISSPHEIFARLFAQWTGVVTDNPAMRAAALKHSFGGFQWTKDEFEALRPLLERVLRLRGVIL